MLSEEEKSTSSSDEGAANFLAARKDQNRFIGGPRHPSRTATPRTLTPVPSTTSKLIVKQENLSLSEKNAKMFSLPKEQLLEEEAAANQRLEGLRNELNKLTNEEDDLRRDNEAIKSNIKHYKKRGKRDDDLTVEINKAINEAGSVIGGLQRATSPMARGEDTRSSISNDDNI